MADRADNRFPEGTPLSIGDDWTAYAEPIPYEEVVPVWWKRALARLLWPIIGRGADKPLWMERERLAGRGPGDE